MLKWVTYDGTEETLPTPETVDCLVGTAVVFRRVVSFGPVKRDLWLGPGVLQWIERGDKWLAIPMDADLEKWETLRNRAQNVADAVNTQTLRELRQALAALAPKEV